MVNCRVVADVPRCKLIRRKGISRERKTVFDERTTLKAEVKNPNETGFGRGWWPSLETLRPRTKLRVDPRMILALLNLPCNFRSVRSNSTGSTCVSLYH